MVSYYLAGMFTIFSNSEMQVSEVSFQLYKMTNSHVIVWLRNKSNSVLHSLAVLLRLSVVKDIFPLNFESIAH